MDVTLVNELVAKEKELNAKLAGLKGEIAQHEAAIEDVYRRGEPLAHEGRRVHGELLAALGLIPDPQAGASVEG